MERRRTDRKAGKVTVATVRAAIGRHDLPGVEGTYSEATIAMEEQIVGYLQGVWEKEVGVGLWTLSLSVPLPDKPEKPAPPLASGLSTLEY
ncbi:hypothetical protein [Streptomyces anulatus]|uniref:hypothetical protein n=1 Tax=Streptomyces anulatus TaxID=1892 RepID=UPI0013BA3D83|nr:hypothetical protein [Streptomyces anulatus]NDZ61722.1 hypothetical protein [Streptomyces anulatus]